MLPGFQKIKSESELKTIKSLYISSFPPNERKEYDELKQLLFIDECSINLIIVGSKIAGFCVLWNFIDFAFIEHFAIVPNLRGLGIGEEVLSILRNKYPHIILETEPPVNEINTRRINFYKRNDFRLLNRQYFQPSYGKNKPKVELKLMSTGMDLSVETIDDYVVQIREKVYTSNRRNFTNLLP